MSEKSGHQGPEDTNEAAFRVVQAFVAKTEGRVLGGAQDDLSGARAKAGRAGGLKGGAARKAALSPERRSQIAKAAAAKRWGIPEPHES